MCDPGSGIGLGMVRRLLHLWNLHLFHLVTGHLSVLINAIRLIVSLFVREVRGWEVDRRQDAGVSFGQLHLHSFISRFEFGILMLTLAAASCGNKRHRKVNSQSVCQKSIERLSARTLHTEFSTCLVTTQWKIFHLMVTLWVAYIFSGPYF